MRHQKQHIRLLRGRLPPLHPVRHIPGAEHKYLIESHDGFLFSRGVDPDIFISVQLVEHVVVPGIPFQHRLPLAAACLFLDLISFRHQLKAQIQPVYLLLR